jgi:hypothetical protein
MVNEFRTLIEDCCGWNRKTWADAVESAVSQLPSDLGGRTVLEVGASEHSSLAPIFAAKGAKTFCSYYGHQRECIANGRLRYVVEKYRMPKIPTLEIDINGFDGTYDVIVLKSVIGGICRNDDYSVIRRVVENLAKNLTESGCILTFDNGYIRAFQRARTSRGAGRNKWTYIKPRELIAALSDYDIRIDGFGYLNFGAATLPFGRKTDFVNDLVHLLDKAIIPVFGIKEHAVLSTVITRRRHLERDQRPDRED